MSVHRRFTNLATRPELIPVTLQPVYHRGLAMRSSTFARCGARVSQRPLTLALGLALGLGSAPLAGLAATISVFTANDAGSATDCTLRQAIVSMNTSSVSGTANQASEPSRCNRSISLWTECLTRC